MVNTAVLFTFLSPATVMMRSGLDFFFHAPVSLAWEKIKSRVIILRNLKLTCSGRTFKKRYHKWNKPIFCRILTATDVIRWHAMPIPTKDAFDLPPIVPGRGGGSQTVLDLGGCW